MTVPIHKPAGWTSFDVVKKLRNVTGFKKVGHGGTLDPFASGLLMVGFGAHTKK
jgi:tRNA pseudouridine55 synthase